MEVANGTAIFIGDMTTVSDQKNEFPELSLEVSENKYYNVLIGYPINKKSEHGSSLIKLYEI